MHMEKQKLMIRIGTVGNLILLVDLTRSNVFNTSLPAVTKHVSYSPVRDLGYFFTNDKEGGSRLKCSISWQKFCQAGKRNQINIIEWDEGITPAFIL